MSESEKIETKPALGQSHPAQCWGWWDAKAKECATCVVSEKCGDATRRLSGKSIVTIPASPAPAPVPVPTPAPKPAPVVAAAPKTIVKPQSISLPKDEETPVKPVEKADPKPEAKPVVAKVEPKPEVKSEPKAETKPVVAKEKDIVADAIVPTTKGEFTKRDTNGDLFYAFKNEAGAVVIQVGYKPQLGKMKVYSKKGAVIMDDKFSADDMKAALDKLL